MSRHRNVRTMNYDDDYEGYYDVYGRSQEEDSCISPNTGEYASQEEFLYNREKLHSMSSFLSPGVLKEENEDEEEAEGPSKGEEVGGLLGPESILSPVDEVRLYECLEKMQNVVGDSIPEATLRRAALEWDFNAETALDKLLSEADAPKPQREPRERRRESDCDDSETALALTELTDVESRSSADGDLDLGALPGSSKHGDTEERRNLRRDAASLADLGASGNGVSSRTVYPVPSGSCRLDLATLLGRTDGQERCAAPVSGSEPESDWAVRGSEGGTLASVEEPNWVATCGRFETGGIGKRSRIEGVSKTANIGSGADGSTPRSADVAPTLSDDFLESLLHGARNVTKTPEAGSPAVGLPVSFDGPMSANIGPTSRSCNVAPTSPDNLLDSLLRGAGDVRRTPEAMHPVVGLPVGSDGPTSDRLEADLDLLLGNAMGVDELPGLPSRRSGGKDDFEDFLTSLANDVPPAALRMAEGPGGSGLACLQDVVQADDVLGESVSTCSMKARRKPALLDLGQILGLRGNSLSQNDLSAGSSLKLDSILKGGDTNDATLMHLNDYHALEGALEESASGIEGGVLPERKLSFSRGASASAKSPSLFGAVLAFFPLGRTKAEVVPFSKKLRDLISVRYGGHLTSSIVAFDFSTPSPDDIVIECRKKALDPSEKKPLERLGAAQKSGITNPEDALTADPVFRQSFGQKQTVDFDDRQPKVSTDNSLRAPAADNALKVPSANSSNRSSPDPERKEASPDSGDAPSAADATPGKPSRPKASSKDVLAEYTKERGGAKPLLNLVVIGHVDAGKSTLMGHLLYRLGCVQKKQMHKYEQDSKKLGKASFMYAWVLDETMEERNRGITMDVAQAKFETPARSIVLLDAPGHKDFIPNMITGAAQADVAILVVDATRGEFETGFEAGGQTREHTLLVRSLGVSQLAVAINKLDNVSWDEGRYRDITAKLQSFLRQAGYREADFTFVPCSGLTGVNLTEPPPKDEGLARWYSGPCLVDVIDGFKPPERPVSKPFRLCVSDVFKGMGSGFCVSGRIDAGGISNGDRVLVMPVGEQGSVKGITIDDMPTPHAFAGDQVALTLSGVDIINVAVGSFLCDPSAPIRVGTRIQCRVVVFNVEVPLTRGFPLVLHYQSTSEQASVRRILSQLHKGTGEVVRHKPRCLTKNTSGIIELKVSRPVCVELYKEFKELGRITLRSGGSTVAAGVITEVS
ncbi:unnamed protein product, partial [Ixodes pacificus]